MIKPMLAQVYDSNKFTIDLHDGVMVQPKLDGIRCIFTKDGAYSRAGNKFMNLAHLELKLVQFFKKNPSTFCSFPQPEQLSSVNAEMKTPFNLF